MPQPRLKVSVNVSLDDILCITEPFVTKPSMARHHYKPQCHMRKMGFYLEGQGHSNWISVHTITEMTFSIICSELLILGGNQLSLTVHVHKLYWRSRSQWRFWTSVNVSPDNISDRSNLVWWCIIISQTARVSFRNIILRCSRSKPQSFLLDLQKYWNFCNPN